ncbi:Tetraspanin-31 [Geodia barretti]|uniref:Tetraspanin-31 n=2 Tax=Geodia barretti TaxID=519541 RepID=A0AA35XDG4_GEOBA|nr:Tetraspanin-31 [Geodia barretti]
MAVRLCGFSAIRCCLVLLNVFYIALALFLIGVVVASKAISYFTDPSILAGLAVCASILFLVAVLGLAGTVKHHQVVLFFYMVSLGLSGIVLFAVSVAALAAPDSYQTSFFDTTWRRLGSRDKQSIQDHFDCCGFNNESRHIIYNSPDDDGCDTGCNHIAHPFCNTSALTKHKKCCHGDGNPGNAMELTCEVETPFGNCSVLRQCESCPACYTSWKKGVSDTVWLAGSFGLIFSFTQVVGIVLSCRFRNLKDPDADPRAFF